MCKVRISTNTLRFRLKQPEVLDFERTGVLNETIEFGPEEEDQLIFALIRFDGMALSIEKEKNKIIVWVPNELSTEWTGTDLVGIEGKLTTSKGRNISVLIEKDFACIDGTEEENEGTYPNPLVNCQPTS